MTPDHEDLRPSILIEIAKAFAKVGSPLDREQLEGMTPAEIYAAAEAMGAGIELLSTVGRWGDTLDDVDVLRHLNALNLFAGPVTTEDTSLSQPDNPVTHPDEKGGDTLDDVDALRHLNALNLFAGPVTTEDASLSQPDNPVTHPGYEKGGDTLDDVDALRHLNALNLFAGPVTTEDASLSQPDNPVTHPGYEKGGDTLDDVDVLRPLNALNLFAGPVTTEDASLGQPDKPVTHPDYEKGCQEVLAPHLEDLIERAVAAGWDHSKVAFSLMYLAGGHLSLKKQESRAGPA